VPPLLPPQEPPLPTSTLVVETCNSTPLRVHPAHIRRYAHLGRKVHGNKQQPQAWIPPGRPGRLFRNATGNTILRVISTLRGANARWSDGDESTDSSHQPGLHPKKTREANETGEFSRQRPPRGYVRLASYYQPLVSWRKWVSQEGITVVCIRKTKRSRGKKGELVKRATSWGSPQRCFPKSLPWAEGSLGPDLGFIENGAFA